MRKGLIIILGFVAILALSMRSQEAGEQYKIRLSDYGFFEGALADLRPGAGVMPYDLNVPLFSDYAHKARFVYLPEGGKIAYNPDSTFLFPLGTVLMKTFYYPADFRKPEGARRLLETRLLIHEKQGWLALPYIWNEAQTEATLDVAGGAMPIQWTDAKGKKQKLLYQVPNMNQCKGCHNRSERIEPIGPSARQLNRPHRYGERVENQLTHWAQQGWLEGLPESGIPRYPDWEKAEDGSAAERALAYLDINCSHCHNPRGPASTSGLYYGPQAMDSLAWGVYKTPVAAGKGSGGLQFDILPGKPDQSILLYRMRSRDPGVMMPELARQLPDPGGIEAVEKWIREMR